MRVKIYEYKDKVQEVNLDLTPTEALIVNQAMRRYAEDEEVKEMDRIIMKQMLEVEPTVIDMNWETIEDEPCIEPLERLAESASKTAKVLERLEVSEQEPIEVEATKLQMAYNEGFEDCRKAVIDELKKWDWQELYLPIYFKENIIDVIPSVNPQKNERNCKTCEYSKGGHSAGTEECHLCMWESQYKPKIGHCKDCKYFEYDSVARVDGIPLIVAHEICSRWGDGCKTKEGGYCFLFEPQESEDEE